MKNRGFKRESIRIGIETWSGGLETQKLSIDAFIRRWSSTTNARILYDPSVWKSIPNDSWNRRTHLRISIIAAKMSQFIKIWKKHNNKKLVPMNSEPCTNETPKDILDSSQHDKYSRKWVHLVQGDQKLHLQQNETIYPTVVTKEKRKKQGCWTPEWRCYFFSKSDKQHEIGIREIRGEKDQRVIKSPFFLPIDHIHHHDDQSMSQQAHGSRHKDSMDGSWQNRNRSKFDHWHR